ncbi:hypothetical protein U1Q18_019190, partial [Sarracenia purpurea var. burkii]
MNNLHKCPWYGPRKTALTVSHSPSIGSSKTNCILIIDTVYPPSPPMSSHSHTAVSSSPLSSILIPIVDEDVIESK